MLAHRIRAMTAMHWLVLFALLLAGWAMLYAMALPEDLRAAGRVYGADFLSALCVITPDAAGFIRIFFMWFLMSAAMMAPTVLPALATYDDLPKEDPTKAFLTLLAGYLVIWIGFSGIASALQLGLFQAGLLSVFGDSRSAVLSAGLLCVAGVYQFSQMKEACLSKCRAPLVFFMQYWEEGPWRNGLRLGLVCLGCCWALMLLGFVGGVMNLAFMGVATVLMILEKLPDVGRVISRPLGVALLVSAVALLGSSI